MSSMTLNLVGTKRGASLFLAIAPEVLVLGELTIDGVEAKHHAARPTHLRINTNRGGIT